MLLPLGPFSGSYRKFKSIAHARATGKVLGITPEAGP